MVSTLEGFTDNSTINPMKQTPVKKTSAIELLCISTNILNVKKKLLPVELELLNQSVRKLNLELHHRH